MRPYIQWLFCLALFSLFLSCRTKTVKTGFLPGKADIVSITASLDGEFLNESSTERFEIDESFFDTISRCLSENPLETIDCSGFGKAIATLEIITRTGIAYRIEFPWSGKNVLIFTINGKWYRRNGRSQAINPSNGEQLAFTADESILLYKALRKQYQETKAAKDR